MALIACPDCTKQVSDSAPSCPSCGRPIAPIQTELTAKRYKGRMAGSFIMALLGFVATAVLFGMKLPVWPGALVAGAASLVYLATIASAWWNNG